MDTAACDLATIDKEDLAHPTTVLAVNSKEKLYFADDILSVSY